MKLTAKQEGDGVQFAVKVVPGSSRTAVAGLLGCELKVTVAAPAEKGRANKELLRVLAQALDRPAKTLRVVAGQTGPRKQVHVSGMTVKQLDAALAGLPGT